MLLYIPTAPDKPQVVSPGLSTNAMNFVTNNGKANWIKGNELASTKVIKKIITLFYSLKIFKN